MALRWFSAVVDCRNPEALAQWWADALDYRIVYQNEREVDIAPDDDTFPGIAFLSNQDRKVLKNRLHLDLNPDDQAAEVARLLRMGARKVDIDQPDDAEWVVLADPEGNEFCVLPPQEEW